MGAPATLQYESDRGLLSLVVNDFTPGLISQADPQDIPLGACTDCENVMFKPGRMLKRLGYAVKYALAGVADGVAWFYGSDGSRQMCIWAASNLYSINLSTFAPTLVASSVYTAGNRITWTMLSRILYYSDGETIRTSGGDDSGISKYDPVGAPGASAMVISSGSAGTIETPACKFMTTKNGQLLLGRIKYVDGTYAKYSLMWSNVLDPTTILGTNIYPVGDGKGGEINCLVNMSVTDQLSYFDGTFVGLTDQIYMAKGALTPSTISVVQLPAANGVLDGATAKFIPAPKSAQVIYLGSDRKVHSTNGIEDVEISQFISDELNDWIVDRYTATANPIFTAARNQTDHHYVLDVGNGRHYCYDWDLKSWTKYARWVNGYWMDDAKDSHANPVMYVTDSESARFVQQGVTTTDDGVAIAPYWKSGWMVPKDSDGDINIIWKWAYMSYRTDQGNMTLSARVKQGQGSLATAIFTPETVAGGTGSSLWDTAIWDTAVWGGTVTATVTPYKDKKRLYVEANNSRGKLQGYDVQVTLTPTTDGWFEPLNFNLLYLPTGRKHVAA